MSDADQKVLAPHFSDEETVDLTLLIVAINGWNRFGMVHPVRKG